MKKSNKILLTIFLTAMLLITAVHIALYAKYQKGDYTAYSGEDELVPVLAQSFPHTRFVTVRNMDDVKIEFADTAKIECGEKDWAKTFSFAHAGDTLLVSGRDTTDPNRRNYTDVRIYLPQAASLAAYNASLRIKNKKAGAPAALNIFLERSGATFNGEGATRPFADVSATAANDSRIELQSTTIQNLNVSLAASELNDAAGTIGSLTIAADSTSRVSLQAKHFSKAKQPATNE